MHFYLFLPLILFFSPLYTYSQTTFCSSTLETDVHTEFVHIIKTAFSSGLITASVIEEMTHSDYPINPLSATEVRSIALHQHANLLIPALNWNLVKQKLWAILSQIRQEQDHTQEDREQVQNLPLAHIATQQAPKSYGKIKILVNLKGPDGYQTYMALLYDQKRYTLRTYDPIEGLGATPYPINEFWLLHPFLFKKQEKLYLGIPMLSGIKIFPFDLFNSERDPSPVATIPYPKSSGNFLKPAYPPKIYYTDESPIVHYVTGFPERHIFIELSEKWGSERVTVLNCTEKQSLQPLGAHQGDLPKLAYDRNGQLFEIDFDLKLNEKIKIRRTLSKGKKPHVIPKEFVAREVSGRTVYLFNYRVFDGGSLDTDDHNYINLYWPDTGDFQSIKTPPYTLPSVSPNIFEHDGNLFLAVYLENQRKTTRPGTLFFYDLNKDRWLEDEVPLGHSLRGNSEYWEDVRHQAAAHIEYIEIENAPHLLIRHQEDLETPPILTLYDFELKNIVQSVAVPGNPRSSRPFLYRDGEDIQLVILSGFREGRSPSLEHYYLSRSRK